MPAESVDPDHKAFLDDYVGRLHRATAIDDGVFARISATRTAWLCAREQGGRVIFIGNGGSAGIASHLAIDLAKNASVPALCFSDASMMSCLANDYGFEDWLAHAVRLSARAGDCLVAISSSGRSKNILNAVAQARTMKLDVITLSGMTAENPLRNLGDVNYYVDSRSYNIVETTHQFWMMAAIDLIIGRAEYPASCGGALYLITTGEIASPVRMSPSYGPTMKNLFYVRHTCRLCHSDKQELVVPMAGMPIGTPNFQVPDASVDDPVFRAAVPMALHLCADCGHLQILHVGNPEIQYRNYVYTTSLSLGLREHFAGYAMDVVSRFAIAPGSLVVELGSNDGSLLGFFRERGMRVLGVDPAVDIARRATEAGIETIGDFFTDAIGRRILQSHGAASVVIANNMIANVDNLDPLVIGVRDVLAPDGLFVFETQYGVDVTEKNLLDTVYHEHLSYFNIKPLTRFFARLGMEVIDVQHIETKGGSIRVTVQRAGGAKKPSAEVARFIAEEDRLGVDRPAYYVPYAKRIAAIRDELVAMADAAHARGQLVAGYGVSVGTTTLLPQFGLENKIDFLVDDDPKKGNVMAGPGYDIPILPPAALYERKPAFVVVFAWRYVDPIRAKHAGYFAEGGKFVVPLPGISTIDRAD